MEKLIIAVILLFFNCLSLWSADGDTFTVNTVEGVEVTYTIISEDSKTCKVGYTYEKNKGIRNAIDQLTAGSVTIPQIANGYTVIWVSDYAFSSCDRLTSIVIPDGVTYLGYCAFNRCTNAVAISIPNSISGDSFSDYQFAGCERLTEINIPEGVTRIGAVAFRDCKSLKTVNIPSTVTLIYEFAFQYCSSLNSVNLPENLQYIGSSAFGGCCITTLTLPKNFTTSYGVNGISYSGSQIGTINTLNKVVISKGVSSLNNVFEYCSYIETVICYNEKPVNAFNCWKNTNYGTLYVPKGSKEEYEADDNWNHFSKIIEMDADYNYDEIGNTFVNDGITYKITNISPREVQVGLRSGAIDRNTAGVLVIPTSVTNSINNIQYSVTSINSNAFSSCTQLTSVVIPNSVVSVGKEAFSGCKGLGSVFISNSVSSLDRTFSGCTSLASVDIPNSVTSLDGTFSGCTSLAYVDIPNSVTSLDGTFSGCTSLAYVDIPNSVTSLDGSFYNCTSLASISIPISVTSIGSSTFAGCSSLISLEIPNSVISIGDYAFKNCNSMKSLTINGSLSSFGTSVFYGCNNLIKVLFNCSEIDTWFKGITTIKEIIIGDNVKSVADRAFEGCKALTHISIGNSVTSIGSDSFTYCSGLTSVNITDLAAWCCISFTNTGSNPLTYAHHLFLNGEEVFELIIPNTVTSIGDNSFYWCNSLTSITIPESVNSIGNSAFYCCSSLTSIVVPESVKFIGAGAFAHCSRLKSISIPSSVKTIENSLFSDCYGLTYFTIPNSISSIGKNAFYNCNSLASIVIPSSVVSIGDFAFSQCYTLTSVKVEKDTPIIINASVFSNRSKATLNVPIGSKATYEVADYWKEFKEIIEYEEEGTKSYSLCISVTGNGSVTFNGTTIRSEMNTFMVNEGTCATISFSPDSGYRIKSVKVGNADVTSSVTDNSYSISDIQGDTTVAVEFEATPPTTYTLTISATGNGSATYDGTTVRSKTSTFTVNEGTNVKISFIPDTGYRIKSVKVDNENITAGVSGNSYMVSNIQGNTTVAVEFEAIPITTYTLTISATGNGSVTYDGTMVRSKTSTFTVNEGTNATISFSPDDGYRINIVKVGGSDVTANVSNNIYTVSNIKSETTVAVEFEAIPPTTYMLTISATGNGSASYNGTTIRSKTSTFTVNEGTNATIIFSPDSGYRIKSVKVGSSDVTSNVSNNSYTVGNIQSDTTVAVEFEAIPPKTYTLTISATGNGAATYDGTAIRSKTSTFTVNEGTNATISFSPDSGNRIKSVKLGNTDVTSSLSGNSYAVSNIQGDTTVAVEFEVIPPTTYTLTISATGNGAATYNGTIIQSKTSTFTVNEGTNATISFTPDSGFRIKSVKVGYTDVTSSVSGNSYTVNNIQGDTTVVVEFEAIPPTTYTLTISATGNGSASYNGTAVRSKTSTFTVNEGTNATISFTPDSGYRIKNLKVGGYDVTASLSGNSYTVSNIQSDTTVEVEFEPIPLTTFTLTISATGNGSASYNGTTIRSKTSTFTVNEGTNATITFSPDSGYRIKSVKVGSSDVTASASSNSYTVSNIQGDITVAVEFEAIPITTYTLTIKAVGNGVAGYNGTNVRNGSQSFTIDEGTSVVVTFTPDSGFHIETVKVNWTDVTTNIVNSQYAISDMIADTSVEVLFAENIKAFACQGVNYTVTSYEGKTVSVSNGNYGKVLTIPAMVEYQGYEWTVTGVDTDALKNSEELAAVIWHPDVAFTATVSNPNLLLYVNVETLAPAFVKNVVVDNVAKNIELVEAASGNSFYCPQEFTAQHISYSHNYNMATGIGEAKGWETIALPFDVQRVMHESKGELVPFAKWKSGDEAKPFWLMQLESDGWKDADIIKAYIPYIISMPNNEGYKTEFLLNGKVTFSAENIVVRKTEVEISASYKGRTFVPTFSEVGMGDGAYALNVSNDYETNVSGVTDGSRFVLNLRRVHPFEAYMKTSSAKTRAIDISDGMGITDSDDEQEVIRFYNLKGQMMKSEQKMSVEEMKRSLPAGVYIINGKKMMVK